MASEKEKEHTQTSVKYLEKVKHFFVTTNETNKKKDETTLDTITTLYKIVYGVNKYKTKLYARYKFNNKLIEESDKRLKKSKNSLATPSINYFDKIAPSILCICV